MTHYFHQTTLNACERINKIYSAKEYFMEGKLLKLPSVVPPGNRLDISYKCTRI
jgi:hypothetical protein